MWFFDWFATYFGELRRFFYDLANTVAGVPYIGGYFSVPFAWVGWFFANLSTASGSASLWSDSVVATANNLALALGNLWGYAYGWLTSSVNTLISQVSSLTTEIAKAGISSITSLWSAINTVSGVVNGWITSTLTSVYNAGETLGAYVYHLGQGFGSDIWTWITSGYIQNWLSNAGYVLLSDVTEPVESSLGYLISKATEFFANNVESFEGFLVWFIDTNINIVGNMAMYFADSLWWLFERIVKQLSQWEG